VAPLNARLDRPLLSVGTVRDRCYGPAEGTTGGSEGGLASPGEESTLAMDESVRGDRMSLSESRMRRVFVEPSGSDAVGSVNAVPGGPGREPGSLAAVRLAAAPPASRVRPPGLLDGPHHVLTVRHQTPSLIGGQGDRRPPAGHLPREGSIVP
jgi:hypothetical protein